jgi:hypothetical protein
VEVSGGGGRVYDEFVLHITNGPCQGIRANATPVYLAKDVVERFTLSLPSGYTDITAAYVANGNLGAKLRAVETALIAAGLMPAGVVA